MGLKWFVQKDEVVDGPVTTEDVQARLQAGQLSSHHMIWGKGLESWKRLEWWMHELPRLATSTHIELTPEMWHYALMGKSFGPFVKDAMIHELKACENLGEVMVWTKGMKEWAPLFEFHELLTAIGVNKRQFPRAELSGKCIIKTVESTLVGQLVSISEGGCGVHLQGGLVAGQIVTLELQSESFRDTLHAKAEVRYVSGGIVGLRFSNVSMETKGAIVQYVRLSQTQTRFVLKSAA